MGARGCLLYTEQVPGDLLTLTSIEGHLCLEPRIRLARGLSLLGKGPGHLIALRAWPRVLQRGRAFLGAAAARARSGRRGRRT
jgi:hypothetical protein